MERDGRDQVTVEGVKLIFSDKVFSMDADHPHGQFGHHGEIVPTMLTNGVIHHQHHRHNDYNDEHHQVATNGVIHVVDDIIITQDSLSLTQVGYYHHHLTSSSQAHFLSC